MQAEDAHHRPAAPQAAPCHLCAHLTAGTGGHLHLGLGREHSCAPCYHQGNRILRCTHQVSEGRAGTAVRHKPPRAAKAHSPLSSAALVDCASSRLAASVSFFNHSTSPCCGIILTSHRRLNQRWLIPLVCRRYVDYPITDVLQMMGRAGRPQFDRHGIAVIMASLLHEKRFDACAPGSLGGNHAVLQQ